MATEDYLANIFPGVESDVPLASSRQVYFTSFYLEVSGLRFGIDLSQSYLIGKVLRFIEIIFIRNLAQDLVLKVLKVS